MNGQDLTSSAPLSEYGGLPDRFITILTPENIEVRYHLAGLATRFLAWAFDAILQVAVISMLVMALSFAGLIVSSGLLGGHETGLWTTAIIVLLVFLVTNGYFIFFEVLWKGQTPGKKMLHLRALKQGGYPITFSDSLVRNLMRLVDWLPSLYAVGVLSALLNHEGRRLGDLAAGTCVVREEPPVPPPPDIPPSRESVPEARRIDSARLDLIRQFQVRARILNRRSRVHIAERLARHLARYLGLEIPPGRSSESYIADLLRSASQEHENR